MTPKEKAEDLINSFRIILMNEDTDCGNEILCTLIAKQCAITTINEISRVCPYIDLKVRETEEQLNAFDFQFLSYWEEVKEEIEKL